MAKSVNGGAGSLEDNGAEGSADSDSTTPICRCRVLYLGSAVPHITKDGLQGIQEPLKDLYPEQGVFWNADRDHCATGIDSWLSVWSNGILVENVDDKGNTVRRFHPIESLHYCAAVRYVSVPEQGQNGQKNGNGEQTGGTKVAKFLPLDSPFSKSSGGPGGSSSVMDLSGGGAGHPPLFACILRRTTGIKVLECHAFICKKEAAANALVRCCFHAYADTMHARQIEMESPYEQLDKRRSRSIGSALDAQSLRSIDEKVTAWQKSSTGTGSSSGGANGGEEGAEGALSRSISRQKARTPSLISLASHHHNQQQLVEVNGHHHHPHPEPIYYNGIGNGTLRSVKSFISLATLRGSSKKQQHLRPRQIPMPMSALPPPPPVMFATMSKKQLKALQKESTLKRKHKYKEGLPPPFLHAGPNGPYGPVLFGPPPPPPHHLMHHPIYGHLPPPGLPPHPAGYFTIDRKGRMVGGPGGPPPGAIIHHGPPPTMPHPSEMGGHPSDEPIYMPTLSSPNGTLMRPMTPHRGSGMIPVEPIYGGHVSGHLPPPHPHHPHHPQLMGPPPLAGPPGPPVTFIPHPQTGELVACTLIPTLSRKELKELEKAKAKLKKAAKKEKKQMKSGKGQPQGMQMMHPPPSHHHQQQLQHEQMIHEQMYQSGNGRQQAPGPPPPPPFPYPGSEESLEQREAAQLAHHEEMLLREGHPQASFNSNHSSSGGGVGGIGGGIYKKKGHLNERAFSYSIRQEHRSRSNSLSNLAFDSPLPVHVNGNGNGNGMVTPRNGASGGEEMLTTTTSSSNHASSVSLKSNHTAAAAGHGENGLGKHQLHHQQHYNNGGDGYSNGHHMNGHLHHQQEMSNGKQHYGQQQQQMHNGHHNPQHQNGGSRINASNGSLQALAAEHGIDPNVLANRMSNLKLNGGGYGNGSGGGSAPPPPPLPPNGYHNGNAAYQKTATIKRL